MKTKTGMAEQQIVAAMHHPHIFLKKNFLMEGFYNPQ